MNDIKNQIDIILVETSHPGNIGSVARAMKTMGLSNLLYLIWPNTGPRPITLDPERISDPLWYWKGSDSSERTV